MLVVIAELQGKPDKREELAAALSKAAAASRQEEGCQAYSFARDLEDDDRYVSVELWKDQAAIDNHFQTPHLQELLATSKDLLAGRPVITTYETEGPKS